MTGDCPDPTRTAIGPPARRSDGAAVVEGNHDRTGRPVYAYVITELGDGRGHDRSTL